MATAVLALQGAFVEHERMLHDLGEEVLELRSTDDLARPFDRLVLPGGESTTQGRLLRQRHMLEPLRERILSGMPVLATCAGLILLARQVVDDVGDADASRAEIRPERHLATLDVVVRRNAYGRQLGSFHAEAPWMGGEALPLTFIRAPRIEGTGPAVRTLASLPDGTPVAVLQGAQLACSFHPELGHDPRVHELFLSL